MVGVTVCQNSGASLGVITDTVNLEYITIFAHYCLTITWLTDVLILMPLVIASKSIHTK
jgi:hypothetical protein